MLGGRLRRKGRKYIMNLNEATKLLTSLNMTSRNITHIKGSFDKDIFLIDDKYILRPSTNSMDDQIECFKRISHLDSVPKIIKTGVFEDELKNNYIILTQIPGVEYFTQIQKLNTIENEKLGLSIASFLDNLHLNTSTVYDIGHYVPIIKGFTGRWRDGHEKYWDYLSSNIDGLNLSLNSRNVIKEAFSFLNAHLDSLSYQAGPVLLHNDFHPKNIILFNKTFSGVIDWECSQYGEADFDLCHLFHWCIFPVTKEYSFNKVLQTVLQSSKCNTVPDLYKRITIYEIEHELIQLIWSNGTAEVDRINKIERWINNEVELFVK